MDILRLTDELPELAPSVATIGFFDGVHRGHQYLIDHVVREARASGLQSMVITFDEHPRKVLQASYVPKMLSTLDSKLILLSRTKIDRCVVLHFDREMAQLSAQQFMQQVLRERLNVRKLIIGYDNRFGHDRREGFEDYVRYGREMGIEVKHNPAFELEGIKVSSSVVRHYIEQGDIEQANRCLGYPYTLIGRVVKGHQEGRRMGFPTANLDTTEFGQLVPAGGVYAVTARQQQSVVNLKAMMNIGQRPTFGGHHTTLEVNIFHFEGDIYGQLLLVSFLHRIRGERKFDSVEALRAQLKSDRQAIEQQFKQEDNDENE